MFAHCYKRDAWDEVRRGQALRSRAASRTGSCPISWRTEPLSRGNPDRMRLQRGRNRDESLP
jgi:hypothetical protein